MRPEFVNYARTAKRVDVKKLKENIWKTLVDEDDVREVASGQFTCNKVVGRH